MKLNDITPAEFQACGNCGCGCPAVFETENDSYVIIGKVLPAAAVAQLKGRIADDELVIEVPRGMIDGLK
jgi:hypothetical protein